MQSNVLFVWLAVWESVQYLSIYGLSTVHGETMVQTISTRRIKHCRYDLLGNYPGFQGVSACMLVQKSVLFLHIYCRALLSAKVSCGTQW